ncbi:EF-Tu/IF-2/RF-3 family GTPase [Streptomyces bobili]|uniref:EF-Tu/IF-2/RF-3 family GTPase n=1 Tax=Streptomyces bobili TaxID=67280 RepID=UPI0037A9D109
MVETTGKPFLMYVEDVFRLQQGRVVSLTGRIERGSVRKGNEVEIVGAGSGRVTACVVAIDQGHARIDEASAGMNVRVLLRGVAAEAVARSQVLATPGSIRSHAAFTAEIVLLSEEQGSADVVCGDRLHFYIGAAAVWGTVTLHGVDTVRPLHGATVTVSLEELVALEEGRSFAFRHHHRAAGSGTVTQLLC